MTVRYALFAVLLAAGNAAAQSYPARPVRLVVGWPPGAAADGVTRPRDQPKEN
jgi:tripartite-type tricarboxylate transporter receptor subunit TctC